MNPEDIALFDLDGTLADYEGSLRKYLKQIRCPFEPDTDDLWSESIPYLNARISMIKSLPGFWSDLDPIPLGFQLWNLCSQLGFHMHILTKAPRTHEQAWSEKYTWCRKHLPADVQVHLTQDKGMVYGKVLVDDYPAYMERWLQWRPRGLGIMPIQEYNRTFTHPNVAIYDGTNLEYIKERLLEAINRHPKEEYKAPGGQESNK